MTHLYFYIWSKWHAHMDSSTHPHFHIDSVQWNDVCLSPYLDLMTHTGISQWHTQIPLYPLSNMYIFPYMDSLTHPHFCKMDSLTCPHFHTWTQWHAHIFPYMDSVTRPYFPYMEFKHCFNQHTIFPYIDIMTQPFLHIWTGWHSHVSLWTQWADTSSSLPYMEIPCGLKVISKV